MAVTEYFHGVRVFEVGSTPRPISVNEYNTVGAMVVAPAADPEVFPEDVVVEGFTNDTAFRQALGTGGNVDAVFDAIDDQGVIAEIQVVRVAEGTGATDQAKLEATIANMVGSGADNSGVHAFKLASKPPKLLIAPGYDSQRISGVKNPVAGELDGIAKRARAIKILNTPMTSRAAAEQYRDDFPDDKRAFLFHPAVRVMRGTSIVNEPASGRIAGLFIARDRQVGGPWESPSNQAIGGALAPSRPISYFTGEPDSEANALNENRIATVRNGTLLWGNETCAMDPLDRFVNVVRTNDMIDDAVVNAFYWAMDRTLSVPHATSIIQSLDMFGDELVAAGAVLGFRVWFDRTLNSNGQLASGILRIEYDREPAAPLQDLQFGARRNLEYYAVLANGILQSLDRREAA
ncbi:hypothetical protein SAMN05428997_1038 [Bosea sp. CRIB-10]|uniref:phage tail sheath C-terminal domain-containing protein n=1 Tax=Bosea sp. CRIB-10 TaxID=378404 RepID=UPI0008EF722F|nr:phage tail sheath C-terminal domain-containing protein [Bosea sp. CRIB-10]SFB92434.1 hypothetical protein SAMN05428997_1038 [Bosea sp. CRIB-10]